MFPLVPLKQSATMLLSRPPTNRLLQIVTATTRVILDITQGQVVLLKEKGGKRMNEIRMGKRRQENAGFTEKFSSAHLRNSPLRFIKLLDKKGYLAKLAKEKELNVRR